MLEGRKCFALVLKTNRLILMGFRVPLRAASVAQRLKYFERNVVNCMYVRNLTHTFGHIWIGGGNYFDICAMSKGRESTQLSTYHYLVCFHLPK